MTTDKDSLPKLGGFPPRVFIGEIGENLVADYCKISSQLNEYLSLAEHQHLLEQARRADASMISKYIEYSMDLEDKLAIAVESLTELQSGCTHDENDKNYRPLWGSSGRFGRCHKKVKYKEDTAKEALAKINGQEGK